MTVTVDLGSLDNQRIRVKARESSNHEVTFEWEGTVLAASPVAILLKPRGAMLAEMIEATDILEIEILRNPNMKLTVRKLRILKPHEVRQHLIDRHGMSVESVDSMDDLAAYMLHGAIDHSGLGHSHEDKKKSARVQTIAEQEIEGVEDEGL